MVRHLPRGNVFSKVRDTGCRTSLSWWIKIIIQRTRGLCTCDEKSERHSQLISIKILKAIPFGVLIVLDEKNSQRALVSHYYPPQQTNSAYPCGAYVLKFQTCESFKFSPIGCALANVHVVANFFLCCVCIQVLSSIYPLRMYYEIHIAFYPPG